MNSIERILEHAMFSARWILAPFYVGLIVAIVVLLVKFARELFLLLQELWISSNYDAIISILTLVDTTLIASLLLIIVFSGYENFVSKLGVGSHEDRPAWMGKVGFSDLKLKLIGAIVAISAVDLLKAFLAASQYQTAQLGWKVGIHLAFVVSGVLFALTDRIAEGKSKAEQKP